MARRPSDEELTRGAERHKVVVWMFWWLPWWGGYHVEWYFPTPLALPGGWQSSDVRCECRRWSWRRGTYLTTVTAYTREGMAIELLRTWERVEPRDALKRWFWEGYATSAGRVTEQLRQVATLR